jgi:outer membrane lipoprotein carrier protein
MKKLFVIILSAICSMLIAITHNLDAKPIKKGDPKAKALLDKVSQKFKSYKTLKADFTLTSTIADQKKPSVQSGKVYIKGAKYKFSTTEFDRLSDGKTIWTFLKNNDEVQVNNVSEKNGELSPVQFFTLYQKGFDYTINSDNANAMEIDLLPSDKSKSYFKVRLTINKKTNMISSATIFEKSGTRLTYALQNLEPNVTLADTYFVFDKSKYPDVEVIDLR